MNKTTYNTKPQTIELGGDGIWRYRWEIEEKQTEVGSHWECYEVAIIGSLNENNILAAAINALWSPSQEQKLINDFIEAQAGALPQKYIGRYYVFLSERKELKEQVRVDFENYIKSSPYYNPDPSAVEEHENELQQADEEESQYAANSLQDMKNEVRKYIENGFFDLIKIVLAAVGDERAALESPPKLGFDEIEELITIIKTGSNGSTPNPLLAMELGIKLLSIDAALKRYDARWWDFAKYTGN